MATKKTVLPIKGMTCGICVATAERALKDTPGVTSAEVNFATEKAMVKYDPEQVEVAELVSAVEDTGYGVAMEKITLPIGGMTLRAEPQHEACASCVAHVERPLRGLEGVLSASVNLATEKATVEYLPGVVGLPDFKRAVAEVGYEVLEVEEAEEVDEEARKMAEARRRMLLAWAFTIPIVLWMLPEMILGVA